MPNIFKVGDKVTVTTTSTSATVDCTPGKTYTVAQVGLDNAGHAIPEAVNFVDDVGDFVTVNANAGTIVLI